MEKKVIDYRFKLLYAIAMIMVVCGHTSNGGITLFNTWFPYYGFHLALFVFASGYFYKDSDEQNIKKYIIKKIKKLLIPLFIYNIVYGIFDFILHNTGFAIGGELSLYNIFIMPIISGHTFSFNLGGWFIIPLFMIEIFNILFRKILNFKNQKTKEIFLFFFYILTGILGNQLSINGYNTGWWLVLIRMLYFIPFFALGSLYKNILEKHDKKINNSIYLSTIVFIQFMLILIYKKPLSYTPSWCKNFYEGPVMPIIVGYIGIAFWFRIVKILEPVIGKNKIINSIADNTYSIMINQFLGFFIVSLIYAGFAKYTSLFTGFNFVKFKSDIWYRFLPRGVNQSLIIYVIAGIAIPIFIQKGINVIKNKLKKNRYLNKII